MDEYFKRYQRELLKLANTQIVRGLLSTESGKEFVGNVLIVKLSPNSVHTLVGFQGKRSVIQAFFWSSDRVAEILIPLHQGVFIPKREPLRVFGKEIFLPQLGLTTSTFTPQTGEGEIKGPSLAATWALERSGSGAAQSTPVIVYGTFHSSAYDLNRVFEPFDTSSIGGGQTIQSSFIKMYRDDTIDAFSNADTTSYDVVKSQQASATSLVNGDYQNFTNTSIGNTTLAGTANAAYTNTTITDQTAINPTGSTKLAIIMHLDLTNTSPTGVNECCFQNRGNANPPTLSVTYVPAPTGGFILPLL